MKMTVKKNCKAMQESKDAKAALEYQPIAFVQESVKKPRTGIAARFERYKLARTIHEAKQLGAQSEDLQRDLRNGVLVQGKRLCELGIVKAIKLFAPGDNELISFAPNPKKPGFAAHARYERYSGAKTMSDAKRRGIWPGDIAHDIRLGFMGTSTTPFEAMGFKVYKASKDDKKPPGSSPVKRKMGTGAASTSKLSKGRFSTPKQTKQGIKRLSGKRPIKKKSAFAKAWAASIRAAPLAWTKQHGWA